MSTIEPLLNHSLYYKINSLNENNTKIINEVRNYFGQIGLLKQGERLLDRLSKMDSTKEEVDYEYELYKLERDVKIFKKNKLDPTCICASFEFHKYLYTRFTLDVERKPNIFGIKLYACYLEDIHYIIKL